MPGCGKSTIGKLLARRLGMEFADSDQCIELCAGKSIRSIFDEQGESAFRELEAQVLDELTRRSGAVIATGGGAVMRSENRMALKSRTTTIYLHTSVEELAHRLEKDKKRPLLQVADPLGRLRQLYEVRDPLYRELASLVVDPGRHSVAATVNALAMQLELAVQLPTAKPNAI